MVRKLKGVSLVELIIGITILSGLSLLVGRLMISTQKGLKKQEEKIEQQSTLFQLTGNLQRYIASGDMRFYAFTGKGSTDRTLARVVLPLPGKCSDLTGNNCEQDVSLIYVHYDKAASPSVSAICMVDKSHLLFDLNNATYGSAELTGPGDGFNVLPDVNGTNSFATGIVKVDANQFIAISNPPVVTLWLTQAKPVVAMLSYNATSDSDLLTKLSTECKAGLTNNNDVSKLYVVEVKPYVLTQFTGGNTVSDSEITGNFGKFPARVYGARMRSIGRSEQNHKMVLGIQDCTYDGAQLNCGGTIDRPLQNTTRIRFDLSFKLALGETNASRYEVIKNSMERAPACISNPNCALLPLDDPGQIPVNFTNSESYESLNATGFSLFKQEVLSSLQIRVTFPEKEEAFNVPFP